MEKHESKKMSWMRFAAMIATSIVIMFVLMYQLVYVGDHVRFSLNRLLASFIMGFLMAALMLGYMWSMYEGVGLKVGVVVGSLLSAALLLYVNRQQKLVGDIEFMQAMIPHHSIAINNAEKAAIRDPRVRRLADGIIAGQVREIREMELLIADIENGGGRGADVLPARPAVVTADMEPEIEDAVR